MSSKTAIGKINPLNLAKGVLKGPSAPKLPGDPEQVEEIETVTADAAVAQQRKKKGIRQSGRQSTVLSGINAALKKRLGE